MTVGAHHHQVGADGSRLVAQRRAYRLAIRMAYKRFGVNAVTRKV